MTRSALLTTLIACDGRFEDQPCTLLGRDDRTVIDLEGGDFNDGFYRVTVETDSETFECAWEAPAGSVECSGYITSIDLQDGAPLTMQVGSIDEMTITLTAETESGSTVLATDTVSPDTEPVYANGEECGEACQDGAATFVISG